MALDDLFKKGETERKPAPEEMKLSNGDPAISLFLADKPVISHDEHEEASDKLRALAARRPNEFKALAGMPIGEAQTTAERLYGEIEQEDAGADEMKRAA